MAGNVTLSSAVRNNLLALQNTASLVKQTQSRLSTGLKVGSAIDDPVAFFQSKALADRASDFTAKKDGIDQGISTVAGATNGVTAIESVVKQLQGLVLNAKSASTSTEVSNMVSQFNSLRTQINKLASDASYQGLNLINGSGSTLTVSFSSDTSSLLEVESTDISVRGNGLAVSKVAALSTANAGTFAGVGFDYSAVDIGQRTLSYGGTITFTLAASADIVLTSANVGSSITFTYGTYDVTVSIGASEGSGTFNITGNTGGAGAYTLQAGCAYTLTLGNSGGAGATTAAGHVTLVGVGTSTIGLQSTLASNVEGMTNIGVGYTNTMNKMITALNNNLTTIRSQAQTLGANVAMLQTRADFTSNYVNTLTSGSGKLNLADLNEEGANLLALQTRQQLGVQALSFAGQAEQAVLGIFR